ncbi:diacylglycerol kinase [Campylobacter sp. W0018]|uniref:diacylglycerol kinase n=1 Tax=Campylobacter TaxID=194 RepID=UPI001EB77AE1|nr:diacylglycerol kinase [Campylobacter sp. W0014]MBZ7954248.1 diacylglycerol kinase [Campylobacter sp. W0018]
MKPKYHILNNAKYALEGIMALFKNEMAFRIEICIIIPAILVSFFLKVSLIEHLILIAVLILILIAESFNSAIEACVDLITDKWHQKAKIAKDCASAGVFFSVILALFAWIFILVDLI